jgi:hypothetical protein
MRRIHRSARTLVLAALCLTALTARAAAVDFQIRPSQGGQGTVIIGNSQVLGIDVVITNDSEANDDGIQGFQMAIAHDAAHFDFLDITWQGTALEDLSLNGGGGPSFFLVNSAPTGGSGITLGVVFQQAAFSFLLGAGEHVVAKGSYRAKQRTEGGTTTAIAFASALGDPPIENKATLRSGQTVAAAGTQGIDVAISDVTYAISFAEASVEVDPGAELVIPVRLDHSPQAVYGFSFGVSHAAASLTFKELRPAADLTSVTGPFDTSTPLAQGSPFYALNPAPAGGAGFTVALILNSSDPTKFLDPVQSPHHIFDIVYTAGAQPGTSRVSLTGELGQPPVGVYLDLKGVSQEPVLPTPAPPQAVDVTIRGEGGEGEPFLRGDIDQGGSLNTTDAIAILGYLFASDSIRNPAVLDTIANCLVALNVDGSLVGGSEAEASINLTDVVVMLNYLFRNGPRPAAPFPSCGQPANPQVARLQCVQFACR